MFAVVFLTLLVLIAAVGAIGFAMFFDVAFCGAGSCRPSSRAGQNGHAVGRRDGVGVALRVERALNRVVTGFSGEISAGATCGADCGQEIRVTTPEALAIVRDLKDHLSPQRIDAIRQQATRNLEHHAGANRCPLLVSGGYCACTHARPISCRTRCVLGADSEIEASKLAELLDADLTRLVRHSFRGAGLDDTQYELNHALVRVLDTPDAERRWSQGERLLASPPTP